MGQQSNKVIKRRRRTDYLKRKQEQAKLGGLVKKSPVKKAAADKPAPAKKAAKKTAKKAAKKAPAKKAAKKIEETAETPVETTDTSAPVDVAADAPAAEKPAGDE